MPVFAGTQLQVLVTPSHSPIWQGNTHVPEHGVAAGWTRQSQLPAPSHVGCAAQGVLPRFGQAFVMQFEPLTAGKHSHIESTQVMMLHKSWSALPHVDDPTQRLVSTGVHSGVGEGVGGGGVGARVGACVGGGVGNGVGGAGVGDGTQTPLTHVPRSPSGPQTLCSTLGYAVQ